MAYFRTSSNGETKLVLTSRDRNLQAIRRGNRSENSYSFGLLEFKNRTFSPARVNQWIKSLYRTCNDPVKEMEHAVEVHRETELILRKRLHATMKWHVTGIWNDDVSLSGSVPYSRALLAEQQEVVKRYEYALNVLKGARP